LFKDGQAGIHERLKDRSAKLLGETRETWTTNFVSTLSLTIFVSKIFNCGIRAKKMQLKQYLEEREKTWKVNFVTALSLSTSVYQRFNCGICARRCDLQQKILLQQSRRKSCFPYFNSAFVLEKYEKIIKENINYCDIIVIGTKEYVKNGFIGAF